MRIISETRLKEAYEKYSDAEASIKTWKKIAKSQTWNNFNDIKENSPFSPDKVKNFVVFNIGGNNYRLIVYVDYQKGIIFIRDFLTHAEYDKDKWKNDEWFDS
ncbi:MAG: type II toxin-antitoxin system HigB family toxin [Rivularia sp. (in: cyanobacteria)]|jgi:mRNA interferase HigB|uniref:Type II toxin-antitoxin system HigB family toxin n=1 Tax=Plectonema cf. radiosum LEGE 06105 TaxID=945769 RepID=A0A8J7EZJ6_9CYAN|nr:type II toxin-antitoxin system HigB family toxin [Plectonema radiosum]MBE9211772.1 type II toxin-antitoxin system HigB family toxin [Plectonema cf. radiosum LEGE 06105]